MSITNRMSLSSRIKLFISQNYYIIAFLLAGFIIIINHEMWEDELQAWLIAKDSPSILKLFSNLKYEGHPGLWSICLFIITRFTQNPFAMQIFHLFLATFTVYIFVKFSPFSKLQKLLFIFGYYSIYEYTAISRNYALGILLLFGFCSIFRKDQPRRYLALSSILVLLSQTSIYGLMIAISLALMLAFDFSLNKTQRLYFLEHRKRLLIGLIVFIAGVVFLILTVLPPVDSGYRGVFTFGIDIGRMKDVIRTLGKGYVPIPRLQYHFWGTSILQIGSGYLSLILLFLSLTFFLRKPVVLFMYIFGTFLILTFSYTVYLGSMRHHGHLFYILVACFWLSSYYPEKAGFRSLDYLCNVFEKHKDKFILFLFSAQLVAGIIAYGNDLLYPFSEGKNAARYIRERQLDSMAMVGYEDDAASTISGYLNREIYYPQGDRWGSFVVWDNKRSKTNKGEVLEKAKNFMVGEKRDILLILNFIPTPEDYPLREIARFDKSIVKRENFYLYVMSYGERQSKTGLREEPGD